MRVVNTLHTPIEHATISRSESALELLWAIDVTSRNFRTAESCWLAYRRTFENILSSHEFIA